MRAQGSSAAVAVLLLSLVTLTIADTTIDYSRLTNCTDTYGDPGVMCYQSTSYSYCARIEYWCRSDLENSCVVNAGGQEISTTDKILCGNNTFWKNIPAGYYSNGKLLGVGKRCNGTSQHQINPWYMFYDGEPHSTLKKNCDDFSDQIHMGGAPCPNQTYFLNIHRNLWCSDSLAENEDICTNPSSWSPNQSYNNSQEMLEDPHFCQKSCAAPGPGCVACENKEYFLCEKSGFCIHPQLRCDGHAQCPHHEDEDMCSGHVALFASFKFILFVFILSSA